MPTKITVFEGLDIFEAIDHAPADLEISRPLAEPAPPLQRARADPPALSKFNLGEMPDGLRGPRCRRGMALVGVVL